MRVERLRGVDLLHEEDENALRRYMALDTVHTQVQYNEMPDFGVKTSPRLVMYSVIHGSSNRFEVPIPFLDPGAEQTRLFIRMFLTNSQHHKSFRDHLSLGLITRHKLLFILFYLHGSHATRSQDSYVVCNTTVTVDGVQHSEVTDRQQLCAKSCPSTWKHPGLHLVTQHRLAEPERG